MPLVGDRPLVQVPGSDVAGLLGALQRALDGSAPAVAFRKAPVGVPDDVAAVVHTSGSTGEPKGVLLTADNLLTSARATQTRLGGPGHWLLALDPAHIAGLQVLVRSLVAGTAPTVLDLSRGFRTAAFLEGVARMPAHGRSLTSLVPTQLRRLLEERAAVDALRGFESVLVGGAAVSPALLTRARQHGVRVTTTYGMTETAGGCVYDGLALDGVRVSTDSRGRISLTGPVVARGYHADPARTAESFSGSTFRTADAGHVDHAGRLTVVARTDDVVITGGVNVALPAVEEAAVTHPLAREAAAFGRPDEEWGTRIEVAVVPAPGGEPTLQQVRDVVSAALGPAAAPKRLHLLAELPLLPSGKVDRAALGHLPA